MACEPNVVCRDKTFQDHTWLVDDCGGCGIDTFNFRGDDTMQFVMTTFGIFVEAPYQFNDDCNSFTSVWPFFSPEGTLYHFDITYNTGNEIWMHRTENDITFKMHRQ